MTITPEETAESLARVGVFRCPWPGLLRVEGEDALRYLHGRCTQDVKSLQTNQGALSYVLSPQGRVQAQLAILREESAFYLVPFCATSVVSSPVDGDADEASQFVRDILCFKVADQISITQTTYSTRLSIRGPCCLQFLTSIGINITDSPLTSSPCSFFACDSTFGKCIIVRFLTQSLQGYDLFIKQPLDSGFENKLHELGYTLFSNKTFEALRIAQGFALFGVDFNRDTVISDLALDDFVSFSKGCYAGQEVVEMSHARGKPAHRFVAFETEQDINLDNGTKIQNGATPDATTCGVITSVAKLPNPSRTKVLGFVKTKFSDDMQFYAAGVPLREV